MAAPVVTVHPRARDNGLAAMLAQLLEENLARADKQADFAALAGQDLAVGIAAPDAGVSLTLAFSRGALAVYDGVWPDCGLVIETRSDKITGLSLVPVRRVGPLRLPDFASPEGRAVARDLATGALRVRGLLRHPLALIRLTRLMSVSG